MESEFFVKICANCTGIPSTFGMNSEIFDDFSMIRLGENNTVLLCRVRLGPYAGDAMNAYAPIEVYRATCGIF